MAQRLTDTVVKTLPPPAKGNKITYDSDVKGFGVRVTAAGARSFILNYRTRTGRERRVTIGAHPDWKTSAARDEAANLKRRIDVGEDPMDAVEADRDAKTVADMCKRFEDEHLPKRRPATRRDYMALINREILPSLKHKKITEVDFSDIDALHRRISKRAPYLANRTVAVLSKMFGLASSSKWRWCAENPAKGIERNNEQKRDRYLSQDELTALGFALATLDDKQAADIFRLLLLTGARRGEVQSMKWDDVDLQKGAWTKPGSTTKQKTVHSAPLSGPARLLLAGLREKAAKDAKYVFPSRGESGHREEIKKPWRDVCIAAGIVTVETVGEGEKQRTVVKPSARIHDLRHTYASVLVSAGKSLPIIGALLGHSNPATTARYAHLMHDPLREATEHMGTIFMPKGEGAEVEIEDAMALGRAG